MGYVNPDTHPETRDFDDQFELDGHGWLFRRFHRARPVRVTAEEMDWSINYFGQWTRRWGAATICASILFMIFWDWLGPDEPHQQVHATATVVAFAAVTVGRRWIWQRATERFARRVPVGIGQSWIEDRQQQAANTSWGALVLPIALVSAGAYFLWPLDDVKQLDIATAAILGAAALFDIVLKLRTRLL